MNDDDVIDMVVEWAGQNGRDFMTVFDELTSAMQTRHWEIRERLEAEFGNKGEQK